MLQFPYALQALPDVLASKWDDEEFKPYRGAFPESAQATPEALQTHVEDLTKRDVKIAYLKNLQGYLWEDGYKTGAYSTPLFRDVAPQLKLWKAAGIDLAIYSSGSVFAQKLLFGHVQSAEDITGRKRSRSTEANGGEDGVVEPVLKKHAASLKGGDANEFETEAASASANHGRAGLDDNAVAEDDVQNGGICNSKVVPRCTEDLQYLIKDWFDTTNAGPKTEASSYTKISDALKVRPLILQCPSTTPTLLSISKVFEAQLILHRHHQAGCCSSATT